MSSVSDKDKQDQFAQHRSEIDHLLLVAKTLLRAKSAVVSIGHNGIGRAIAHLGLGAGNATFAWRLSDARYALREPQVFTELKDATLARVVRTVFGETTAGAFVRIPVLVEESLAAVMLFHLSQGTVIPSKEEISLAGIIARRMTRHVKAVAQQMIETGSTAVILSPYKEILAAVAAGTGFRTLLDAELRVLAVSPSLAARIGASPAALVGSSYFDWPMPISGTMALLFRHAQESGIGTPEIELTSELTGNSYTYRVRATPIRPVGHDRDILDITVTEIGSRQLTAGSQDGATGFGEAGPDYRDAAADFLVSTLVPRRTIRTKAGASFVTVRAWRSSIKAHQITALKAIKQSSVEYLARVAGAECAREIDRLVGTQTFKFIVPVPCGHSKPGICLSSALARSIGVELNLPVINAFSHMEQKGSSHPKSNVGRPSMKLVQSVPGPALLIDDVATSGDHIAEAANLLKAAETECFALAWIGGDSA